MLIYSKYLIEYNRSQNTPIKLMNTHLFKILNFNNWPKTHKNTKALAL